MSTSLRICLGISATALLVLGTASRAHAGGGPITAHQLAITLRTISQTDNASLNQIPDRFNAQTKDVFEACTGSAPTKTQGLYLFLDCSVVNAGVDPVPGTILAIETNPLSRITDVATVQIHTDFQVISTKSAGTIRTQLIAPVEIALSCNGASTTATLAGVMTMKYSALSTSVCPDSASIKILGAGDSVGPGEFTVDAGSLITVKKRAGAIATIPP
jgi:hypothetical protein